MRDPPYHHPVPRVAGFTIVELMIVVSIIGVLAVVGMPSFVRARENSQIQGCMNNLRQIDQAKSLFAFDNQKVDGDAVTSTDIDSYLKRGFGGIEEPAGGSYTINAIGTDPTCSQYDAANHPSTI